MTNIYLLYLCDFLSVTVVVNTFIYKIPQVYIILSSGSSEGVSLPSVVLEWIAYSIMLTYQFAMEYPFSTYMENTIMVSEDLLLAVVIMLNRKTMDIYGLIFFIIYVIGFVSISMKWLPDVLMLSAIGMTTPILCWSKIDQLVRILHAGHPGRVSALTWFIASYDTAVRILTTIVITGDIPMLINLSSSEIFNVAIFASVVILSPSTSQRRRSSSRR